MDWVLCQAADFAKTSVLMICSVCRDIHCSCPESVMNVALINDKHFFGILFVFLFYLFAFIIVFVSSTIVNTTRGVIAITHIDGVST